MIRFIFLLIVVTLLFSCEEKNEIPNKISISSGSLDLLDSFPSQFVTPRNIAVWKPDDYSENKLYNVLYMHDGQSLFDSTITWNKQEWMIDETISKLLQEDQIKPTIVVGIWNSGKGRHADYFPQKPFEHLPIAIRDSFLNKSNKESHFHLEQPISDRYLKFIVEELKPYIDQHYSTINDSTSNYIAGSSMGGLISWYAVCEYPNVFYGAACLSTHWPGNYPIKNNPIPTTFYEYLSTNLPDRHKFYFDHGTETLDSFYPPLQVVVDSIMRAKGYDDDYWITKVFEGTDHSENAWNKRMDIPLKFLLGKH